MNRFLQSFKYALFDFMAAILAYTCFFYYRKIFVESKKFGVNIPIELGGYFVKSALIIGCFWLCLYLITGTYKNPYRKSRLNEFFQTFLISLIGCVAIFFAMILDDTILSYKTYYVSFLVLFGLHFFLTFIPRFILSSITAYKVHNRLIGFDTIIVGSNEKAKELYEEMSKAKPASGERFVGYVRVDPDTPDLLADDLTNLGPYTKLPDLIAEMGIEDVILAVESSEHHKLEAVLNQLEEKKVIVKIIPDMYDILSGSVKMNSIFGTPLIEIDQRLMPTWQLVSKRAIDIFASLFALIILSPVYLFTALMVKLSSPGPILFKQKRIGLHGKPFYILKFRSMFTDAEKHGPQLSSDNDPRITSWGRIMRKYRLDELPQFYNVLIGDMSLVGPRPEREYYIEKIVEKAPAYRHLHKVQPGITSWGMVKYGYAEDIDEMITRMKYDLLYVENMSLLHDIKILVHTVLIVLQGRGK